jgi:hypothetical protein
LPSYYELLDVAPTAEPETIKHAFRREIARYHPDKVQHLGREFQALAAERAATLTAAYKTLLDPALRADYDAGLGAGSVPVPMPVPPPPEPSGMRAPEPDGPARHRFEEARQSRDAIMLRAVADHVRQSVTEVLGVSDEVEVRGFDLVLVPRGGGGLLRSSRPLRVLTRFAPVVDAALAIEMWSAAARARLHLTGAPLCVLLIGEAVSAPGAIAAAIERQRARGVPGTPRDLSIVPVDVRDWTARPDADSPAAVRRLVDRLRKWTI